MKFEIKYTSQFKKDYKLAQKQGRDTKKLFEVIDLLANGEKLDKKYRDHNLSGNFCNCKECHIEPDWLLIYQIEDNLLLLILNRIGSHSELFSS